MWGCYSGRMRQLAPVLLSLALAVTFTTSGFLHSIIPHNDTRTGLSDATLQCAALYGLGHCPNDFHPTPDQHQSALWSFIHSALSHEEKKSATPAIIFYVDALLVLALAIGCAPRSRMTLIPYELQLARGVLPHRRFG